MQSSLSLLLFVLGFFSLCDSPEEFCVRRGLSFYSCATLINVFTTRVDITFSESQRKGRVLIHSRQMDALIERLLVGGCF